MISIDLHYLKKTKVHLTVHSINADVHASYSICNFGLFLHFHCDPHEGLFVLSRTPSLPAEVAPYRLAQQGTKPHDLVKRSFSESQDMIDTLDILGVAAAFLVVAVSPGPANIAVATVAMSAGRTPGLLCGAGLALGLAVWGLVAATGMGAVLQGSALLLSALKIAGGLYLLWLALQSARAAARPSQGAAQSHRAGRWFLRGLILNLSNPKAVVAWMAALSMGLGAGDGWTELLTATALCMLLGLVNYTAYALAFSLSGVMATYRRLHCWIDGAVAALFTAAGLALIRSAFAR